MTSPPPVLEQPMTTTETRPDTLAQTQRDLDRANGALERIHLAVQEAHRGGATVMRLDAIRRLLTGRGHRRESERLRVELAAATQLRADLTAWVSATRLQDWGGYSPGYGAGWNRAVEAVAQLLDGDRG